MKQIFVLYLIACIVATFKLSYDLWLALDKQVPFTDCLDKVLFDQKSYTIILMTWRAFC